MSHRVLADLARPFLATVLLFDEADGPARPSVPSLKSDLNRQLDAFEASARSAGVHSDEIADAAFALSVWADEVVMADHDRQNDWMGQQLQLTRFDAHDGGDQFYARLEALRPDFHRARWIFALCLAFGFRGRFKRDLETRDRLLRDALTDLENDEPVPAGELSPAAYAVAGHFSRPTTIGLRHIVARWSVLLILVLLGICGVLFVLVRQIPGGA